MTTSGSVDHSVTRDNIIDDALMIVGGIDLGGTPSAGQYAHGARQLNNIVKAWQSMGISLWARATGYVLPFTEANSTTIGPSGGHVTASYVQTTLSASASDGASTITVTSATGISNNYYIGIEMDDNTMHWTTVNGAPSGTTVTLTATIDDDAASGNYVYVYQTKLARPVRVVDSYIHDQESNVDYPLSGSAFSTFTGHGSNETTGVPVQWNYDPQLLNGVYSIYPQFDGGRKLIIITYQRPFQDFDATGDTPDFPQEGYDALVMALAARLAPVYGLPVQDRALLKAEAKEALDLFRANEPEEGSLLIQPY